MRTLLFAFTLMAALVRGNEDVPTTMRERLHAMVLRSTEQRMAESSHGEGQPKSDVPVLFAPPVATHPLDLGRISQGEKSASGEPVVVLEPFTVFETRRNRALETVIERQTQKQPFSATRGGTVYAKGPAKIGSWWNPKQGWSFLQIAW